MLTQERLKELLHYNPETGIFTWLKNTRGHKISDPVGHLDSQGYVQIKLQTISSYKIFHAHRLAWLYMRGAFPSMSLDHIDSDRKNNKISNLREVSISGNAQNQIKAHSNSKIGMLGVSNQHNSRT